MAVRSGLMEDVNRGPRVEENVEIHMKDKQPKATEADGKEKKQFFESRRVDVVVTVDEDGEIIRTSTENQEFVALPGVVYEYWAKVTIRNNPECQNVTLEKLIPRISPSLTQLASYNEGNIPKQYPTIMRGTSYNNIEAGTGEKKMDFGYIPISSEGTNIINKVAFALWDIKYEGKYTLGLVGDACGYSFYAETNLKLDYDPVNINFFESNAGTVKCVPAKDSATRTNCLGMQPLKQAQDIDSFEGHSTVFKVKNPYTTLPLTFGYLRIIMESESSYCLSDVDEYTTWNPASHVLDIKDGTDAIRKRTQIVVAPGKELFLVDDDAPCIPLPSYGNSQSCSQKETNKVIVQVGDQGIIFYEYLMMRVGKLENNLQKWEPEGTNWIPVKVTTWNMVALANCPKGQACTTCEGDQGNKWLIEPSGTGATSDLLVDNYGLPFWSETAPQVMASSPYAVRLKEDILLVCPRSGNEYQVLDSDYLYKDHETTDNQYDVFNLG